jgi:hypothetical protein
MTNHTSLHDEQYSYKNMVREGFDWEAFAQKDAFSTDDADANNEAFGRAIYNNVNLVSTMYGVLPKYNSMAQGGEALSWRASEDRLQLAGITEGGNIDSDQRLNLTEVTPDVKVQSLTLADTHRQRVLRELEDSVSLEDVTPVLERHVRQSFEVEGLGRDPGQTPQYGSDNSITPLARAVANGAEEGTVDDTTGTAFSDGDLDYAGQDRSNNEYEAFVDFNGSGGSGTDRSLTEGVMDSFVEGTLQNGDAMKEEYIILTGYDTASVLQGINQGQNRIVTDIGAEGRVSEGDADSVEGVPTSVPNEYKGIPIFQSRNVTAHGSLSDVYMLPVRGDGGDGDRPRIGVEQYGEPVVVEDGPDNGDFAQGDFTNRFIWAVRHELIMTDASSCGKLRDLQE